MTQQLGLDWWQLAILLAIWVGFLWLAHLWRKSMMTRKTPKLCKLSPYFVPEVKGWVGLIESELIHPNRLSTGPNFVEIMDKDRSLTEGALREAVTAYPPKNKFLVPIYAFEEWLRPQPKPRSQEEGPEFQQKPSKP